MFHVYILFVVTSYYVPRFLVLSKFIVVFIGGVVFFWSCCECLFARILCVELMLCLVHIMCMFVLLF